MCLKSIYLIFILALCAYALSSCGQDKNIIKPPSGDPTNQAPRITSMSSSSTTVQPDKVVALYCDAYDPDDDSLYYLWLCDSGVFTSDNRADWVHWQGPMTTGNYIIRVKVSDGQDFDSSGIGIEVR
ncbi:MAG: hypothetical protein AB1746_06965 [Candidatus Zixiibacteriota bacterium]